ncbi:MAG: DUF2087 domain-containing protein [Ruminiclostridium sp.]|nr:DUF2087 domain-containing protein [Ruminiclostridium sp.]MBQ8843032.1 DUF2087 domain-containing protein [Ruminiclostridium sp.]
MTEILKSFLDNEGRLTAYPSKRKMKLYALIYIAGKIEKGRTYTEKEINSVLNSLHTFNDPATLRRELYTHRFLDRDSYGKEYRMEEHQPAIEELEAKYS